ncbi:MAG: glycosyltransferase family 2 protein [Fibrobacteres bacterium]|nr:glycosyltransferase family 2 protein [Fibrobacterota bacterium]
MQTLTLAIPAYNRNRETRELLQSILDAGSLPDEVIISENCSPERKQLAETAEIYGKKFNEAGVKFSYFENEKNLGYDGNARSLFRRATSDWVLLFGNDDKMRKPGVTPVREFIAANPSVRFFTCALDQFYADTGKTFHITKLFKQDSVEKTDSSYVFRLASFISGITINRKWALSMETDIFDGGLFYQVYLSAVAFIDGGLGYVATPIVGGRSGNSPDFGAAESEKKFHTPGRFPAASRARMYASVLEITRYVDSKYGSQVTPGVMVELDSRQLFHVYEELHRLPRAEIKTFFSEMRKLGMGKTRIHKVFYCAAYYLHPIAPVLFRLAREMRNRT